MYNNLSDGRIYKSLYPKIPFLVLGEMFRLVCVQFTKDQQVGQMFFILMILFELYFH